jgi:hypothetical protein
MIDFRGYNTGSNLTLKLIDTKECIIEVSLDEIEWDLHRHPHLVDLKIISSSDEELWPIDSTIVLGLAVKDEPFKFILREYPSEENNTYRETIREAKIEILN